MAVLAKIKHEQFSLLVADGKSPGLAYAQVYGPSRGADQSACRLLKNAKVSARIGELSAKISDQAVADCLSDRLYRSKQRQIRYGLLLEIVRERGLEYQGVRDLAALRLQTPNAEIPSMEWQEWSRRYPLLALLIQNTPESILIWVRDLPAGAATGLMVRDYKGLSSVMPVYKVDTGLLAELRNLERAEAEDWGQLSGPAGSAAPAAVTVPLQVNVVFR